MHRIFIAINLPRRVQEKLSCYQLKWPELPCRWTKQENLHITLEFLGNMADEELIELFEKTKEIAKQKKSFLVKLNKITYGPPQKNKNKLPRMVWVTGEKIKEFNLTPHITLGRIKTWQFKNLELEERPQVEEEINLSFPVQSIEIMESRLKKNGPEYFILESCPLQD